MKTQYDFSDVEPLKINEEEPQMCRIMYNDTYKKTMGTVLALMKNKEYSERALYLTDKGIEMMASHYSLWVYRYDIVTYLNIDEYSELKWSQEVALKNEKNYQIWNYRRLLIERILEKEKVNDNKKGVFEVHQEHDFVQMMLESDPKNHHVWTYMKWLIERKSALNDSRELAFVTNFIDNDIFNNSAWNLRFFLQFNKDVSMSEIEITEEINFVKRMIEKSPQNASSWNYLIGSYSVLNRNITDLETFCLKFVDMDCLLQQDCPVDLLLSSCKSNHALELLATISAEKKDRETASRIYDLLSTCFDTIRANYWNYEKLMLLKN